MAKATGKVKFSRERMSSSVILRWVMQLSAMMMPIRRLREWSGISKKVSTPSR